MPIAFDDSTTAEVCIPEARVSIVARDVIGDFFRL
jgi:hypothetical protein